MSRLRLPHLIFLFGGMIALPGCFQSDGSPTSASDTATVEEEAIQSVIFEEEGELTDLEVRYFDDGVDGPASAPIATDAWRRELLDLDKTVAITIHQETGEVATADVSISAEASGLLHLLVTDGDAINRYTKDFNDTGTRSMYFERVRRDVDKRHRGWHLLALSGVAIESPGTTRVIRSVRVQAGDVDETITGVSELVRVADLLTVPALALVTVTVDTGDATDHVFLHRRHARARIELMNNGDGTFTGTYQTRERSGPRHIAIDVLSHDTLYDDVARYDNAVWGIPYRIGMDTGSADTGSTP